MTWMVMAIAVVIIAVLALRLTQALAIKKAVSNKTAVPAVQSRRSV